jgi:hypothetical protein
MDTAIYAIYNPGRFGGSTDVWSDKRDAAGFIHPSKVPNIPTSTDSTGLNLS